MSDIVDRVFETLPATAGDIVDRVAAGSSGDLVDQLSPPVTHEDAMQAAGSEVLRQNVLRRSKQLPDLNSDESGAILDAFKRLGGQQPDKLRQQLAEETAHRTQLARGVLGDAGAGAFEAVTSYVPAMAGLIDPQSGLRLKQGQEIVANADPTSIMGQFAGFGVGLGKFALTGPLAPILAGVEGAGEQRMTIAKAREKGEDIGGTSEVLETTARGVVDGVLTKMFMKAGDKASNVVRSLIQPSVKEALAASGLDTARKLAWTWAMDSLKVGALSEGQYLADIGLGHLADPSIVPTKAEALRAAAFGIVLPSVMGAVHGVGGRLLGREAPPTPVYTPEEAGRTIPGTENLPIPPLVRSGGPLATVPGEAPRPGYLVTPPPTPGEAPIYSGEPGPPTPRVLTPFPPEGSIKYPQIIELIQNAPARGVAPDPTDHPMGREPAIVTGQNVPDLGGTGTSPEKVYVSKALPQTLEIEGKPVDVHRFVALHETTERSLREAGESDDAAHAGATAAEHDAVRRAGVDPVAYEKALEPYERTARTESLEAAPEDLDKVPYQKPAPAIPRPKTVVTQEREIEQYPEGATHATPHLTYDISHLQSPAAAAGGVPLDTKGENLWVRPAAGKSNAKRQLLVQFSTDLINADRPRSSADDYYDKLYANRDGYSRPKDFWELPQWIGVAAKNLPNADVYVVRNLAEAQKFLAEAGYGHVAMSALDVNTKLAQALITGYKGKVVVGGYTDMTPFKGQSNVTVYKAMPEWIKAMGKDFTEGTDYRHFRGTEVVPRLSLSEGCLHNCFFCGVENKGKAPREIDRQTVDQQIASFKDLKAKLVYVNDKTFGQASNHQDLKEIYKRMKAENPEFQGFIIQTSAAQMAKMTPEFLQEAGVKYVEMGVESYNDSILKSVRKPANEKMIDAAVEKIRASGAKFIPNIMIGLPGETPETYSRTLDFLDHNRDLISHVNAYNTALYAGSDLAKQVGGAKSAGDADENVTQKSWQADPAVDQSFHDAVMKFGSDSLDTSAHEPGKSSLEGYAGKAFSGGNLGGSNPEMLADALRAVGGADVIAAGKQAIDTVRSAAEDLQRTFSPGSRGTAAKQTVAEMRQENSRAARSADIRYRAYDQVRRAFDVYTRLHGQIAADDFMDRINRGEKQSDPELQSIADTMDMERRDKVKQMEALGTGATEKFDENWFGRQWANSDQARLFFRSRKPLTGSKSFLKGRTLESVAEGRAAGLELVTDNPVEMHIMKMGEMDKYIAGVSVIKSLETNGAAKRVVSGDAVPPGWQRIHDQIGLYKAKNPVTGEIERGSYYAPEEVATLINNHLSPGLRGKAWFKTYLGAANWLNQFQLGMSGFHLAFTSGDAIVSKLALSLRQLTKGDVSGAVTSLLGVPFAPITNAIRGHTGLTEWFHRGSQGAEVQQIISILEDAGARVQSDPFYRTHVTDKIMKSWRQGNILGSLGRALLLPVELPTRFIMDVVVPRQKLGVAMDIVRMEMRTNPGISRDALVAKARSAWDSADNRMGQLVYDNLFWNHMTKDIAMATVRSVGWNLGTFREVIGGGFDLLRAPMDLIHGKPVELTNRAAYILALPMIHAAAGSFLQYVFTGQGPQTIRDAFFPQTGSKDEKGRPQRTSLPTYCKDIYHFGSEPLKTLENKVHPMIQLVHEMLINKDFYGVKIANEDDPMMQKLIDEAKHVLGAMEPLSSRNLRRGLAQGQTPEVAARSFLGITPAPSALNESDAERVASDIIQEKIPAGARTSEAAAKSQFKRDIARQLRSGNTKALSDAIGQQKISTNDASEIIQGSHDQPLEGQLKHLSASEALKVWAVANPDEKKLMKRHMIEKLFGASDSLAPAEFNALAAQYRLQGVFR
jgi:hypothetical protein